MSGEALDFEAPGQHRLRRACIWLRLALGLMSSME